MHQITLNLYVGQRLNVAHLAIVDVPRIDSAEKGTWWCSNEYVGQYLAGWFTLHSISTISTYFVPQRITYEGPQRTRRVYPAHQVEIGGFALFYDAVRTVRSWY